jgi:hypothetical protein
MGPFLLSTGRAYGQTIATMIGSLVLLVSLFFLVSRYGALGTAISSLSFYIGWGVSGGIQIWKIL